MRIVQEGATSQSVNVYAIDNTTGLAKTGLAFGSAGIGISYRRDNAAVVSITLVTLAALTTAWTSGGFLEIGNGWYRLDVPDAAFVTGTTSLLIEGTVTGAQFLTSPIQLAGFAGGLPLSDASGRVDIGSLIGVAQSAIDLKDFVDTGYDPATKKVQGVVLVDTTFVNTDMRGTDAAATAITIGTPANIDIATDLIDIKSDVDSIGSSSGGALPFNAIGDNTLAAIKGAVFSGTVVSGTFASTAINPTTRFQITDPTLIDIVLKFNIGGSKQAIQANFTGFINSSNDSCIVQFYDFVGAVWETAGIIPGQNQAANITTMSTPLARHTGTGVDLGDVFIRFICTATSPTLNIAILLLDAISVIDSSGYAGMISVNTIGGGQNGQNPQVNGTIDNPVITIADMNSLLVAKNFTRIDVQGNSSLTLTTSQTSRVFTGFNWTLALGGQDISDSFFNKAIVSGSATSISGTIRMDECRFNSCTLPPIMAFECGFLPNAVITAGQGGTYTWFQGHNMDTFTGSVVFDYNRVVNTAAVVKMQWKPGFGSITIKNMKATDECSIYGNARLIIDATCTQGGLINADNSAVIDNVAGGFTGTLIQGDIVTKLISLDTTKVPDIVSLANIRTQADDANLAYDAPTNAEMNARTLPSGSYFDPFNDIVADVTNVNNVSLILDKTNYQIAGVKKTLDQLNDITAASVWTSTTRTLTAFSTTLALSMWSVLLASISISGSIGLRFKELLGLTITGNVDTSTFVSTTTVFETNLIETTTDHYKDQLLKFTSGSLAGQQTSIDSYVFSANSKGKFTVVGLTESPSNGTTFEIT